MTRWSRCRSISVKTDDSALPVLNLTNRRVFVLTGDGTCSASESIINGLRGVDVEVYQIGSTTCGKPYGFYPTDNCGTTYFTIQFRGANAKDFGDYSDGFSPENTQGTLGTPVPGCSVADDFNALLGDPAGGPPRRCALNYRDTQACPPATGARQSQSANTGMPSSAGRRDQKRRPARCGPIESSARTMTRASVCDRSPVRACGLPDDKCGGRRPGHRSEPGCGQQDGVAQHVEQSVRRPERIDRRRRSDAFEHARSSS